MIHYEKNLRNPFPKIQRNCNVLNQVVQHSRLMIDRTIWNTYIDPPATDIALIRVCHYCNVAKYNEKSFDQHIKRCKWRSKRKRIVNTVQLFFRKKSKPKKY